MDPISLPGDIPVRRQKRRTSSRLSGEDVLVFIIPFFEFVHINLIGVLSGTDVLLLITFVVYLLSNRIFIPPGNARKLFIFAVLWLISQVVTDLVRHSQFSDFARGWSSIALTIINFTIMCSLLYRKPRRIAIYGWGLVVAGYIIMLFMYEPDQLEESNSWKMGWAYPVTMSVFLFVSRKACSAKLRMILMIGVGLLNFLNSARSAGGFCFAAAIYIAITPALRRRTVRGAHLKLGMKLALGAAAVIGIAVVFVAYQYGAESGLLGQDSKEKYEQESSGKYGLLVGGRVQLLSTIPAIIDSPVIGHGSWPRDVKYLIEMRQALVMLEYKGALDMSREELTEGIIPAHSFLLGAWVWAGFLGALFWAWVGVLIVRSLSVVYPPGANLLPLMAFVSIMLLWDILFSPFGMDRRQQVPYYLILIMTYYDQVLRSTQQVQEKPSQKVLTAAPAVGH